MFGTTCNSVWSMVVKCVQSALLLYLWSWQIQERITAIGGYVEIMEKWVFGLKSGCKSLGTPMLQLNAIIYGEYAVKGKLQKHIWRINRQFILLKARNTLVFYIPWSINQCSWYCGYSQTHHMSDDDIAWNCQRLGIPMIIPHLNDIMRVQNPDIMLLI